MMQRKSPSRRSEPVTEKSAIATLQGPIVLSWPDRNRRILRDNDFINWFKCPAKRMAKAAGANRVADNVYEPFAKISQGYLKDYIVDISRRLGNLKTVSESNALQAVGGDVFVDPEDKFFFAKLSFGRLVRQLMQQVGDDYLDIRWSKSALDILQGATENAMFALLEAAVQKSQTANCKTLDAEDIIAAAAERAD